MRIEQPWSSSVAALADPPQARRLRASLVSSIAAAHGIRNPRVLDALRRVPRHWFAPGTSLDVAYGDFPLPIGRDQTISQPAIVAVMTDALDLRGHERVLEIGTGSGYQAAILSLLAREVYSIEWLETLGRVARNRLANFGYSNVMTKIADGYLGWPEVAPFDRILLTAAPRELPQTLLEQLNEGGILVAPIGPERMGQTLYRIHKRNGAITEEDLGPVRFVPMVRDHE